MIAKPQTVRVPIVDADTCGHKSPKSALPCRRATGHTGRHAFIRWFNKRGTVREVWA